MIGEYIREVRRNIKRVNDLMMNDDILCATLFLKPPTPFFTVLPLSVPIAVVLYPSSIFEPIIETPWRYFYRTAYRAIRR